MYEANSAARVYTYGEGSGVKPEASRFLSVARDVPLGLINPEHLISALRWLDSTTDNQVRGRLRVRVSPYDANRSQFKG